MTSVITTAITNALIIALVPLSLRWAARAFPARELNQDGPTLEELKPRYKWWDAGFTVLYLLMWIPATAAIYYPLYYLDQWRIDRLRGDDATWVYHAGSSLFIPAFFGAIILAAFPTLLIQRIVLGQRSAEYYRYAALKHGIDPARLLQVLSLGGGALAVLMALGLMGWYVVPARDKLVVNPLFGFERTYAYSDIAEAETADQVLAPNGNRIGRPIYIIRFKDGFKLDSDYFVIAEYQRKDLLQMMRTIIERSDVPLAQREYIDKQW